MFPLRTHCLLSLLHGLLLCPTPNYGGAQASALGPLLSPNYMPFLDHLTQVHGFKDQPLGDKFYICICSLDHLTYLCICFHNRCLM